MNSSHRNWPVLYASEYTDLSENILCSWKVIIEKSSSLRNWKTQNFVAQEIDIGWMKEQYWKLKSKFISKEKPIHYFRAFGMNKQVFNDNF